jgi:hypothetical protein
MPATLLRGVSVAVPIVEKPDGSLPSSAALAMADEYAILRLQLMNCQPRPDYRGWLFWRYDEVVARCAFAGASDPLGEPLRLPFCDVQTCIAAIDIQEVHRLGREAGQR